VYYDYDYDYDMENELMQCFHELLDGVRFEPGHIQRLLEECEELSDDLFHMALSTRNTVVLRLVLNPASVQRISPEQLEFFTPYDDSMVDSHNAYELSTLLFKHGYVFGDDETSTWFHEAILENHAFFEYTT